MDEDLKMDGQDGAPIGDDGGDGSPTEAFGDDGRNLTPEMMFVVGSWSGLMQWRCTMCEWDTLHGEAEAREHFMIRHVLGEVKTDESHAKAPGREKKRKARRRRKVKY